MDDPTTYLYHHLFLPTRVPHCSDSDNIVGEEALVAHLISCARQFTQWNAPSLRLTWDKVHGALKVFAHLHGNKSAISSKHLDEVLRLLGDGQTIILHVKLQNSALTIRREAEHYHIESFEAAAPAKDVLSAPDALRWEFPSQAVAVETATFEHPDFRKCLCEFVEKASVESIKQFAAITLKAGSRAYESRDVTSPAVIGQLLVAILEAIGVKPGIAPIQKRIRDEVCWNDGAENPWRRSATWLVVRVAIQRILTSELGAVLGRFHYKMFVCMLLSTFCDRTCTINAFPFDSLEFARRRVGRRAAKLRHLRETWGHALSTETAALYDQCSSSFLASLKIVNARLNEDWTRIRARAVKRIKTLPRRADSTSVSLTLFHSGKRLWEIINEASFRSPQQQPYLEHRYRRVLQHSTWTTREFADVKSVADYLHLSDIESSLIATALTEHGNASGDRCMQLFGRMTGYHSIAREAYRSAAEQSSLMLLLLMELWQTIDASIIKQYPLLAEYDPGFPEDLLHVLQLSRLGDMRRLANVEQYLAQRSQRSDPTMPSIFGNIAASSFQVRYFDHAPKLQSCLANMKQANQSQRVDKAVELEEKSAEYEALTREASRLPCLVIPDPLDPFLRIHDDRGCTKCFLNRKAGRISIEIHEAILPSDEVEAKALVFELRLVAGFAAWRDATWFMMQIGQQKTPSDQGVQVKLPDLRPVKAFALALDTPVNIRLASRKKSFYDTHYAHVKLPVTIKEICHPHGPRYSLLDCEQGYWTDQQFRRTPDYSYLCSPPRSSKSSYANIQKHIHPTIEGQIITSNMVIARQTECPNSLSTFEYTAFQELRMGNGIQWIRLVRELGSSNMNFGVPEVTALVSTLALMAGPPSTAGVLRVNHWVFNDSNFCAVLTGQIRKRLEAIAPNWRESQTLECMDLLAERLWSLASDHKAKSDARNLILLIRKIARDWVRLLRDEICNAADTDTAQKRSKDALLAALLCRKTFALEATDANSPLVPDSLACFLECAFTMRDNLPSNASKQVSVLTGDLQKLYISDIKLTRTLEDYLRQGIQTCPKAVSRALNRVWGGEDGEHARKFTIWSFLPAPQDVWVTAKSVAAHGIGAQEVHFDIVEGTLLIDGRPQGRLPEEYSKQPFFQDIFGSRVFLTYPSGIPGMSYMLSSTFEGHNVHFGFRDGIPFMRVRSVSSNPSLLEYIPSRIFFPIGSLDIPDLPWPLIEGHIHWLDISNQKVIVRPQTSRWRSQESDWTLDLKSQEATRRRSLLVDPRSAIFDHVASLICPFEQRKAMVVYQPQFSNLSLRLPSLELSFEVNYQGLLESRQLRAVIDPDQDIGTFYGLNSSLVLKDTTLPDHRSILVPMGPATIEESGRHRQIKTHHNGFYARFAANKLLGRLECACEPRLIFFKAYCHAITASVMPDPLTGRTGTEEALRCLTAGNAQPWAPYDEETYKMLASIAALTPKRCYYPDNIKVLQRVQWQDGLVPGIQHDSFRPLVQGILDQCHELSRFNQAGAGVPASIDGGDQLLLQRAELRAQKYLPQQGLIKMLESLDHTYEGRDSSESQLSRKAFEAATYVNRWSMETPAERNLAEKLRDSTMIQGFTNAFDMHLLSDMLTIDVATQWGPLFKYSVTASVKDKQRLMFLLAILAFGNQSDLGIIRSLIAVAIQDEFKTLSLPEPPSFINYRIGEKPTEVYLVSVAKVFCEPYTPNFCNELSTFLSKKVRHRLIMAELSHEELLKSSCKKLAKHLGAQWPIRRPSLDGLEDLPHLDAQKAVASLEEAWEHLYDNHLFDEHIADVQAILDRRCSRPTNVPCPQVNPKSIVPTESQQLFIQPALFDLMSNHLGVKDDREVPHTVRNCLKQTCAGLLNGLKLEFQSTTQKIKTPNNLRGASPTSTAISDLESIISKFAETPDFTRRGYGKDLSRSLHAFQDRLATDQPLSQSATSTIDVFGLEARIKTFEQAVVSYLEWVHGRLTKKHDQLRLGGLLPRITPVSLLESLRSVHRHLAFNRTTIRDFALLMSALQRLRRTRAATLRKDAIQLPDELREDTPPSQLSNDDWLLLEIDFNMRIRPDQYNVARAMIDPSGGRNSVLQMNMGQGKSSVIIPMIVANLAGSKNLVRVVVPKPLLQQTAQLLQGRLGGLLGRKIKHVAFSRRTSTDAKHIQAYFALHNGIAQSGGVMLTLPEHILSFQLSGLQELCNGRVERANSMIKVHSWLQNKCRDILDECDHMLAVKTQLIYPSGAQNIVDGHPFRWTIVQMLLKLTKSILPELQQRHPRNIEVIERSQGAFPTVYLLSQQVRDDLLERLTDSVLKDDGHILPTERCSPDQRELLRKFLCCGRIPKTLAPQMNELFRFNINARNQLLVLRGFLVHRILILGLGKRWNVQYGIHPGRDPIAVPFTSKGVPSEQAEFGHPDVSIVLTCLSFYNSGLTFPQFSQTLNHLIRSDEPVQEFESWRAAIWKYPDSLRAWNSINIDDETQTSQLWKILRMQMPVVNYFLNNFVFPRHARTFKKKLTSSAWDLAIPQISNDTTLGNKKENVAPLEKATMHLPGKVKPMTVGFSGTNDNKDLLPLNIKQNDLPGLSHTTAEVLTYLLQPRNRKYVRAADPDGKRLLEKDLLVMIAREKIRMLLDAGAQILELDNESLVSLWLQVDKEAEAGVYFGGDGRARVLFRDGKTQPLTASPYLDNLGACVVYLDEAHTRGVDLKMPAIARAALTLGIMQTKDHTVQAAMRLRQLGISQSVVFYAPPEVHQSILNVCRKSAQQKLDSCDVVYWLLEQTCCTIEQLEPLFVSQGQDYCRRQVAARDYATAEHRKSKPEDYLQILEQAEQYSLEQLYSPNHKVKPVKFKTDGHPELSDYVTKLDVRKHEIRDTGDTVQALAHQEVEQEREVEIEVETVREVKKPNHAKPLPQPSLHCAVRRFAETGHLSVRSLAFTQAFDALKATATGRRYGIDDYMTKSRLFVTQDFNSTVALLPGKTFDEYARPVRWIIWSTISDTALIVSDYEADALLPTLCDNVLPSTHLITYAAPVTRAMVDFDKLDYYIHPALPARWKAPTWLVRDLGIFAGRLYFDIENQSLCNAIYAAMGLQLPLDGSAAEALWRQLPFDETEAPIEEGKSFSKNALPFMQEWLAVRRHGQDFSQTMMGDLCRGRGLMR